MSLLDTAQSQLTLPTFVDREAPVSVPNYDRSSLFPGVIHLGVGSFHRAHQAVFFDRLARAGDQRWGVIGVGIHRSEIAEVLQAQNTMFTVVERGAEESRAHVVGSIIEVLVLADQPELVVARLSDPRVKLVTLTITGDGYTVTSDDQGPGVFDVIVDGLEQRRARGWATFTVLSCDNLPDSAERARTAVLAVAGRRSAELADWIDSTVGFPASMVDRITPATTPQDRDQIAREFQIQDRWPVITEPFAQWVVEDSFSDDRPPLDTVGAAFVADVGPHKLIKARLLNGTHSALSYLGLLAGIERTDAAMADPVFRRYLRCLIADEIAPLLPQDVVGMELPRYGESVLHRLSNPAIADPLIRLARRGSTKMASYLLPSLAEGRSRGWPMPLLSLALAGWLRYAQGTDLSGRPIEVADDRAAELAQSVRQGRQDPRRLLASDLFGELTGDVELSLRTAELMDDLDRFGVVAVMQRMCDRHVG